MVVVFYEKKNICCNAAGQFVNFFKIFFGQLVVSFHTKHHKFYFLEKKLNFTSNLLGQIKPEYRRFSLQTLVVFFSTFRLTSAGFTTGQKQYEHILCAPHRAKFQDSGHKKSSHARHLEGCAEFESLFLAFNPK